MWLLIGILILCAIIIFIFEITTNNKKQPIVFINYIEAGYTATIEVDDNYNMIKYTTRSSAVTGAKESKSKKKIELNSDDKVLIITILNRLETISSVQNMAHSNSLEILSGYFNIVYPSSLETRNVYVESDSEDFNVLYNILMFKN